MNTDERIRELLAEIREAERRVEELRRELVRVVAKECRDVGDPR